MTNNCIICLRNDCMMKNAAARRKVPGAQVLLHREPKKPSSFARRARA